MKRHGNLYEKLTTAENIHLAWQETRKGKSFKAAVRRFELDAENNLAGIRELLVHKTFQPSPYKTKWIYEPKKRMIYILPFAPDRIIHHALMQVAEPIWTKLFISDSYACIRGRGLHAGSRRTMEFVRRNRYCLKMDISKFYPSVDHAIMFQIIKNKIKCPGTLDLFHKIIYSTPDGKNVPIGNYTSQWMGNLYLSELDIFVKQTLRVKDYVRYCDDFLLFGDDKSVLNRAAQDIERFLSEHLTLTLSKCDLFPVSRGVDFLGYRHFPGYVLLRKSTSIRIRRRLGKLPGLLAAGRITLDRFRGSVASINGWMKWANAQNFRLAVEFKRMEELARHGGITEAAA
ncbi:MAG: reverse transcriptase domain-containing protein [Deltaproteobacteria bacterium]|nr:reverse transcriptase domain-containing protein [Deltaproteobacteria bacterium]